jgi:hypothetical protein
MKRDDLDFIEEFTDNYSELFVESFIMQFLVSFKEEDKIKYIKIAKEELDKKIDKRIKKET